jgi:integrase
VALLKTALELKPSPQSPLRPHILYILILLLYTTGMRLGEALKLQIRDIDWKDQTLYIRETKFFKSRIVPLSSSMVKELQSYLQLRRKIGIPANPESPLFQGPCPEKSYSISTIQRLFCHMLRDLGIKPIGNCRGPRPHDLRATFAVHRLEQWYRKSDDVQTKLGLLSTYLGHVGIASTQRYLPMTTELLQQASHRFNRYFTLIPKEAKNEK